MSELLGGPEGENQIFSFIVRSLIRSQIELKKEQDEMVNVYLARLLLFLADPAYQQWTSTFIKEYDTALSEEIKEREDRVQKYFLYKVNADHLLTSLGIFHNLGNPRGAQRRFYEPKPTLFIGRGKAYYGMAAEYNHQIYHQHTAVEEVLQKLSSAFEEYVRVLSYLRSTYLDFVRKVSEEDLARFIRQLEGEQK